MTILPQRPQPTAAQRQWAMTSLRNRLRVIRRFRRLLASDPVALASSVDGPRAEVLVGQVMPLADACRFLERRAERVLAPKREGRIEIRREPFGVMLIIGPSNYPLFLPAVQALQALVAGNAVVIKPGAGGLTAAATFTRLLYRAGLEPSLCTVLDESVAAVHEAVGQGVDKVVFTGSANNGVKVNELLASRLIPATMELSGDDPVIVRADADLELVRRALGFGRTFNNGNTCIAPRRVFVADGLAIDGTPFATDDEAIRLANDSPYALGATIFSRDIAAAQAMAGRLNAGVVVINDMIAPTADPRVPFGGRDRSGFGVTRGEEGLLEMTRVKTVITQNRRWLPHLDGARESDLPLFHALIQLKHAAGFGRKIRALARLISSALDRNKNSSREPARGNSQASHTVAAATSRLAASTEAETSIHRRTTS
jgi:acyl-CoA reductase-like NAD-dependent aldehyde dehydrogenase